MVLVNKDAALHWVVFRPQMGVLSLFRRVSIHDARFLIKRAHLIRLHALTAA